MLAKLIGLCAGLALLCFFIESDLRRARRVALWQASLRERYTARKQRFPALERFLYEAREAGVSLPALIGMAAFVFVVGALVVSWAEESVAAGVVISLGGTLAGLAGYVRVRYRKRRNALFQAWLREAMPIAITTLRATGHLDSALEDAAALVRDRRLGAELQQLVAMWKGLHTVSEQAFGMAAERWGVEEIRQLARLTEEAVRYHADLAELWLRFRHQVERDEDKRRTLRAKTLAGRRNGLIYAGIVVAMFGVAYPRVQAYMTQAVRAGFWVVLMVMLACTWAIWRAGEVIEV